ncbi:putative phosphoenolpyruvate synthase [Ischnura elegans]|uniref:putative phosphoenolpyruvate synthase n=1 Tax=Ischnura elegans TaxID=197161 RepID=UPI001ED87D44|nr:putative phosphoenolpyruvate synthase [Ischnura elegans]XP_046389231.1 putative phosphoenolpyruvate synthase [Ischnura elegans]
MDYAEALGDIVDWIITTVFKNVVLFACPVIAYMLCVRFFNEKPKDEEIYYSRPGRGFYIKKLWALICLWRMNWVKKKEKKAKNSVYGLLPTPEEVKYEKPLNLNGKYGTEYSFIFGIDSKRNFLILRISSERQGHRLHPEVWIHACICDEIYQFPMHPDSGLPGTGPLSYSPPSTFGKSYSNAAGLKFEALEPMRKWRIQFNGILRKGCLKEMTPMDNCELVHVKFNFIWTACSSPFYAHRDSSLNLVGEALAREPWRSGDWIKAMLNEEKGYDQWGTLNGEWKIGDFNESPVILHLRGVRRRRWGPSDNGDEYTIKLRHKAEFFGVSSQGSFFNIGASSMSKGGLTHTRFGHFRDPAGIMSSITSCDISLPQLAHFGLIPDNSVIRFSANNRNYTADIRILQFGDAVLYTGRPWKYKTCLAIFDFGLDVDGGVGISEFTYRYDGHCPLSSHPSQSISKHFIKHVGDVLTNEEKVQLEETKPLTLHFTDPICQNSKVVGGKGASLAVLTSTLDTSFQIPDGFCLTTFAFQEQIKSNDVLWEAISKTLDVALTGEGDRELQKSCERVVSAIKSTPVCVSVIDALEKGLKSMKVDGDLEDFGFAVRSSAVGEDSELVSAAGQNSTVLGCSGIENTLNAVRTCWSSLYTYQSVLYRRQYGNVISGSQIAVVVQKMVPSESAGVLFTHHPYSGNPSQIVITANYGLGESVVAAMAEPDMVTLKRNYDDSLSLLESKIGRKSIQVSVDGASSGTKEDMVSSDLQQKLSISYEQALRLGKIGIQLEAIFSSPRDIEWAIVKDHIFILQARPITALESWSEFELLHELDSSVVTDSEVTTRANTGEVLPGAMTPLTSSVMAKALDVMIHQSPNQMKLSVPHFLRNAVITHHQLAMNVINTFFRTNEPKVSLGSQVVHMAVFGSPCVHPELLRLGIERHGMISNLERFSLLLRLILRSFRAESTTKRATLRSQKIDLKPKKFKSARDLYEEISANLYMILDAALDHNNASVIGVFSQVILVSLLIGKNKELKDHHFADISLLLSSCSNVISAEIPQDLQQLASKISKSDGADEFCSSSSSEAADWFAKYPGEAASSFKEFLDKHGHRCLREFDLGSLTWGMKPDCLMNTLQTMVRAAGIGQERHKAAIEGIGSTIKKLQTPLKTISKLLIKRVVPWCRRSVARREETKCALVRTIHAFRMAYRHLGFLARMEGLIPDEELVFYFTHYELSSLLGDDDALKTALIVKAWRRRKLRSKWDKIQLPETFFGVAVANDAEKLVAPGDIKVSGVSASIGVVTGRACVIGSLDEANNIQPEDILITKSTDIGWTPYFPFLSGIVTEMGGLISHGAVVAREYGLPCIVGASSATQIFKTGDKVTLDASTGILYKVDGE